MRECGLLLGGGGISSILGVFTVYFNAVVSQLPLFSPLELVVGPLRAAASLTIDKASPAGREGTTASSAVVYPGFLAIAIVMQVIFPALGGVFRVPLLLWRAHWRIHIGRVSIAAVAWIISPVPTSPSDSGEKSAASASLCVVALVISRASVCGPSVVPWRITWVTVALLRVLHPLSHVLFTSEVWRIRGGRWRGGRGRGGWRAIPLLLTLL